MLICSRACEERTRSSHRRFDTRIQSKPWTHRSRFWKEEKVMARSSDAFGMSVGAMRRRKEHPKYFSTLMAVFEYSREEEACWCTVRFMYTSSDGGTSTHGVVAIMFY